MEILQAVPSARIVFDLGKPARNAAERIVGIGEHIVQQRKLHALVGGERFPHRCRGKSESFYLYVGRRAVNIAFVRFFYAEDLAVFIGDVEKLRIVPFGILPGKGIGVPLVFLFDDDGDLIRKTFLYRNDVEICTVFRTDLLDDGIDVARFEKEIALVEVFVQPRLYLFRTCGRRGAARFVTHVELRDGTHGIERDDKHEQKYGDGVAYDQFFASHRNSSSVCKLSDADAAYLRPERR